MTYIKSADRPSIPGCSAAFHAFEELSVALLKSTLYKARHWHHPIPEEDLHKHIVTV